jgi:hypothetical protein
MRTSSESGTFCAHASWALLPGIMGAMIALSGGVAYALVRLMEA